MKTAAKITAQEAWTERDAGAAVEVPDFFRELVEEIAFAARQSEFVDQSSGRLGAHADLRDRDPRVEPRAAGA